MQTIWSTINPATTSGTQLATLLNDFKNSLMTGLSGVTRPDELDAGGAWIDTSQEESGSYWMFKIFDGTNDIEVFRVNLSTGKASFVGTESSFEISKVSADAVGPLVKFIKNRIANNGQVLTGDIIGQFQFIGKTSAGANPVVGNIKFVAGEDQTVSNQGSYLVIEQTKAGTATAVEVARLIDGKLGIGTQAPDSVVHAYGPSGIKSEVSSDDAVGALVTLEKSRVSGNGSVQTNDTIGRLDGRAKDSSGTKSVVSRIEHVATEGHTSSAKGSKISIQTTKTGTTTLAEKLSIGDKVETVAPLKINSQELVSQSVATSSSINQLSASKSVVEFTGSTATDLRGINSANDAKVILLHNLSSAIVTLKHENSSATAADRLKLPDSSDLSLAPNTSIELYYCSADSRWKLKSGGGILPDESVSYAKIKLSDQVELIPYNGGDLSGDFSRCVPQFLWSAPSKISDPASTPAGISLSCQWSPNGEFVAVAHSTTPYVTIYQKTGNTLVKLSNPGTLPTGNASGVAWSPSGEFLAVSHTTSPYVTIYQRSGNTFTKVTNPGTLPTGNGNGVGWSSNGEFLAVAHTSSPYVTIYQRSGTTFTKLTDPGTLPTGTGFGAAFSANGEFLAVSHTTTPFITIYQRSGTTFTKVTNPGTLPTGNGNKVAWSVVGDYLSVTHTSSPYVTHYQRSGTTFTKLTDPASLPGSTTYGVAWSPNGRYVAVGSDSSPFVHIYERSGTTLTLMTALTGTTSDNTFGLDFSRDGQYLAVGWATSPYLNVYQTTWDMPATAVLVMKKRLRDGQ